MRIRVAINLSHPLLIVTLVLASLAIACDDNQQWVQPEDTPTPPTAAGPISDKAGELHTPGLCIRHAPLAVSVGDTWMLSGTTKTTGILTEDTSLSNITTSYTVKVIEDGIWHINGQKYLVGRSKVQIQSTISVRDREGNLQIPRVEELDRNTIQVADMGPLLTLDWECHRESWLEAWSEAASTSEIQPEPNIEERTMSSSSGLTVVVFSVKRELDQSEEDIEGTIYSRFGYDKETGKLVLIETFSDGTRNSVPFTSKTVQEIVVRIAESEETSVDVSDTLTHVSMAAPIESIEIEYAIDSPLDTSLIIISGLQSTCAKFEGHTLTQQGDTILVSVTNAEPTDENLVCVQTRDNIMTRIHLGSEIEECEVYKVVANGKSYSIQAIDQNTKCAPPPELGVEIQVSLDKTVRLESEGLRVGLLDILEDSRCPPDMNCVQEGQAIVMIDVAHDASRTIDAMVLTLGSGDENDAITSIAGYLIKLIRLEPYPVDVQKLTDDYVAILVVTKE